MQMESAGIAEPVRLRALQPGRDRDLPPCAGAPHHQPGPESADVVAGRAGRAGEHAASALAGRLPAAGRLAAMHLQADGAARAEAVQQSADGDITGYPALSQAGVAFAGSQPAGEAAAPAAPTGQAPGVVDPAEPVRRAGRRDSAGIAGAVARLVQYIQDDSRQLAAAGLLPSSEAHRDERESNRQPAEFHVCGVLVVAQEPGAAGAEPQQDRESAGIVFCSIRFAWRRWCVQDGGLHCAATVQSTDDSIGRSARCRRR
mmetsp:Transcript_16502/g.46111  ORF Transcript_16502/g.46111 Transcript_16502/m.46111 type:complete len:259 (-) Transcript_16502:216-992(-)